MDNSLLQQKSPLALWRVVCLLIHYFVGYIFVYPFLFAFISMKYFGGDGSLTLSIQWLLYTFILVITLLLAWPLLKESFQVFKHREWFTFKTALICYVGLYFVMMFSSLLVSMFTYTTSSSNQQEIAKAVELYPTLQVFVAIIFAPIVEEIIFRGCLFRVFRSKYSFMIACAISFITFGFLHVFQSFLIGNFTDLWYLIPYGLSALFLCHCYEKTANIYGSMLLHLLNNMISIFVLLQLMS